LKRHLACSCLLAGLLFAPAVSLARAPAPAATAPAANAPIAPLARSDQSQASAASSRPIARGTRTGVLTTVAGSAFVIQTPGRWSGVIDALTSTATKVTKQDYPYVYGGGHAHAGTASVGIPGAGYNGRRIGYDCSGSVAAVLAGGGLWAPGSGVPNEAWEITEMRQAGLIAPGVATGPLGVNLYDDPGIHIFMSIDGGYFGTSDGGGGGDAKGGAGWLYDGAPLAWTTTYKRYHVVSSALKGTAGAGHRVTFQLGGQMSAMPGLVPGVKVRVSYEEASSGVLTATAVTYPGAATTTGTVVSVGARGRSFTIDTPGGSSISFSTGKASTLTQGLELGDAVTVLYTKSGSTMTAHEITVTAPPSTS
jgi:hypothetical protein